MWTSEHLYSTRKSFQNTSPLTKTFWHARFLLKRRAIYYFKSIVFTIIKMHHLMKKYTASSHHSQSRKINYGAGLDPCCQYTCIQVCFGDLVDVRFSMTEPICKKQCIHDVFLIFILSWYVSWILVWFLKRVHLPEAWHYHGICALLSISAMMCIWCKNKNMMR